MATDAAAEFNARIRAQTFFLLVYIALTTISTYIIGKFRRSSRKERSSASKSDSDAFDEEFDDTLDALIPRLALSLSLSTALLNLFWYLVQAVTESHFHRHPTLNHLPSPLQWMDKFLFDGVAANNAIATHISVYILLPLAYLYSETPFVDSYGKSKRSSMLDRVKDAGLTWFLVMWISVLGWWMFSSLLGLEVFSRIDDSSSWTLWRFFIMPWLHMNAESSSWILLFCGLLSLRAMPFGVMSMLRWSRHFPLRPGYRSRVEIKLEENKMELSAYRRRLEEAQLHRVRKASFSGGSNIQRAFDVDELSLQPRSGTNSDYLNNNRQSYLSIGETSNLEESFISSISDFDESMADDTKTRSTIAYLLPRPSECKAEVEVIKDVIAKLEKDCQKLERHRRRSPFWRNIMFFVMLLLILGGWVLILLRIALTVLRTLFPPEEYLFGGYRSWPYTKEATIVDKLAILIKTVFEYLLPDVSVPEISKLLPPQHVLFPPTLDASVRLYIASYFTVCYIVGTYSASWMKGLLPKHKHSPLSTRQVVGNVMLWCMMGQAIPVIGRMLTGIGGKGAGGMLDWHEGWLWWLIVQIFRCLMLVSMSLEIINRGVVKGVMAGLEISIGKWTWKTTAKHSKSLKIKDKKKL